MKDLRDWYSYLERSARVSASGAAPPSPALSNAVPSVSRVAAPPPPTPRPTRSKGSPGRGQATLQERLPIDLGAAPTRRPGRPPLTETREEIIERLLDPELSVHEAAALLNVSKATLRRYTDSGKLACFRTAGGQRRFKLSAVLALLETGNSAAPGR
jgi:excisionase family DNA binding protein